MDSLDIAIAGAGLGGLAVALPLSRVRIVKRFARIPPMPRLLAGIVAGQLLSPIKAIGLEPAPLGEVR